MKNQLSNNSNFDKFINDLYIFIMLITFFLNCLIFTMAFKLTLIQCSIQFNIYCKLKKCVKYASFPITYDIIFMDTDLHCSSYHSYTYVLELNTRSRYSNDLGFSFITQ